ncbi:MAG: hemolysin family protein [Pseudomonadota bacterium]
MGETNDGSSRAAQGAPEEEAEQGATPLGFLNRLLGLEPEAEDAPASEETAGAQAMIVNVRRMGAIRVEDVAVPRADIVAVADTSPLDEVVKVFRDSTFTRLPVYKDTLDTPIGFVHLKDIALRFGFDCQDTAFDLAQLMRPLLYVPPSMPVAVLLQKMQTERIHMALVIDEYGGVDGVVTIEDLVEQVVGEIADEHDIDESAQWIEEAPGVYLCLARAPLQDFEQIAGVDLLADELDEDVDTLGGLVFMLAGRVPLRGEVIPHPQGHEFEVVEAGPRMLKRVRVRLSGRSALDRAAE